MDDLDLLLVHLINSFNENNESTDVHRKNKELPQCEWNKEFGRSTRTKIIF